MGVEERIIMKIGIIGGGPGGYVAAIRASMLGAEVTIFERERVGGICTNHGCIPTKALFSAASKIRDMEIGKKQKLWEVSIEPDWRKIIDNKNKIINRLVKGIEFLLKKNGIRTVYSEAKLVSSNEIVIPNGTIEEFDYILLATGSEAAIPPVEGLAGISPWENRKALATEKIPETLIIIGAGVVGVEMANIFASFGSKVTIVEILPRVLPMMDTEISALMHRALTARGIKIILDEKIVAAHRDKKAVFLELENSDKLEAEEVLVATGRHVITPSGMENIGLILQQNRVLADETMKTDVDSIYVAGDIAGEPFLAHKASHQGIYAVENMMGANKKWTDEFVPSAIWSALEVGCIGLSEVKAREKYGDSIKSGKFPYLASGKALCEGDTNGFIKVIADTDGIIVGFHSVGKNASELLGLGGFLVQNHVSLSDVSDTVFAHPTLSEMVHEATLLAEGKPINI